MVEAPLATDTGSEARSRIPGPLGAVALGIAVWVGLVALYAACVLLLGGRDALAGSDPPFGVAPAFRFNTIYAAVIGFVVVTLRIEGSAIPRDLAALRPVVAAGDAQWERWRTTLFAPGRGRVFAWVLCGALVGQVVNGLGRLLGQEPPAVWRGHYYFMAGFASLLFGLLVAMAAMSMRRARVFLEMGRCVRVLLLSPETLKPFARAGLRGSAYWLLGSSLASLLMLDASAWGMVASILVVTLGLGFLSLLLPSRGVHESLRDARRRELEIVRGEIERCRAALLDDRAAGAEAARMPALLAWETRVEAVGVWPFDAPILLRFALFLIVPLGSWLGGALVERAVDTLIR